MNRIDYNKIMEEEISKLNNRPKLLLHVCCAPCSTSVLQRLVNFFDVTIYFYNPNMDTQSEYDKRKIEAINLVEILNKDIARPIKIVIEDYNSKEFLNEICGLEGEKEGGKRCDKCFEIRLRKSCEYAKQNNFDYFTTTLSVSPYKNATKLNEIGLKLEKEYKIKFLCADFKKKEGYLNSIKLSKKYNLYRQDYCGCIFSKGEMFKRHELNKDN